MTSSIRQFREHDIAFALTQTAREGWDATTELFQLHLAHDPEGCFIAECDGDRAGMITTTRYARTAWIGNLIVLPDHRRQGIGERLMTHAMTHLSRQGVRTVRLEADPLGIKLYKRLGFVDEFDSLRFRLGPRAGRGESTAQPLLPADLAEVRAFDGEYFGDDRGRLLDLLLGEARAAYWLRADREVRGYAMVLPSAQGVRLGPWVAVDREAAQLLLQSILESLPDTSVVLGVPGVNRQAIGILEAGGFSRTPSSYRMIHGERAACGDPGKIYAIANGAVG